MLFCKRCAIKKLDNPYVKKCSVKNEDDVDFPSIWPTKPYGEAPKSEKKYYAEVGGLPEENPKVILDYIHDHMQKRKGEKTRDLELWYVWLGNDEEDLVEKAWCLADLTEESIKAVFLDSDTDYKITIVR